MRKQKIIDNLETQHNFISVREEIFLSIPMILND